VGSFYVFIYFYLLKIYLHNTKVKSFKSQTRTRGSRIDAYYITLEFKEKDKKIIIKIT